MSFLKRAPAVHFNERAHFFDQVPKGSIKEYSSAPILVKAYPSTVFSTKPMAVSSLILVFRVVGETDSQYSCSSRKVIAPELRPQRIPIAQCRPRRSSRAIIGAPVREPRTGLPGVGNFMPFFFLVI